MRLTSLEVCAGAGGQALGLDQAGFHHVALVEIDHHACNTLRANRPHWNVLEQDVREFHAREYKGAIDLLSGGVPCPPFSKAGKQLGSDDERDLFPEMIRLATECDPKAIMIENVRGLLDEIFDDYRTSISAQLEDMGYAVSWKLLNASDYGVPQLRPRVVMVALKHQYAEHFSWPERVESTRYVGDALYAEMASCGWSGAKAWRELVKEQIAPTLVGGSKKHGGPDLGPTRAKKAWEALGINGHSIAEEPPGPDFEGMPRLTVKMAALVQGFPADWKFTGRKTPAYRQVGNAFPPPVANAVGQCVRDALLASQAEESSESEGVA